MASRRVLIGSCSVARTAVSNHYFTPNRLLSTSTCTKTSHIKRSASDIRVELCRRGPFSTTAANGSSDGNLKIWQYRVSDQTQSSTAYPDSATPKAKSRLEPKATLYTPSADRGWDVLKTRLGSTDRRSTSASSSPTESIMSGATFGDASQSTPSLADTLTHQLHHHVLRHFLPANYPSSVAPGYQNYALFCFAANSCGSAAMVLSTQALLLAVGVGSASAAPMAGAINWVLKDGIGQLGGILFASRLGSAATGSSIDTDPKRWRMASAISMDGATWLEILSPLFPQYFLPIASVANIGKNIGFLTASASRAAIHQAMSQRKNLGDITAKAGSQSIAASLVGTALGIGLSPLMQGEVMNVAAGFAMLSVCHQYATYKSLTFVHLKSLNRHRLNIVMEDFVKTYVAEKGVVALDAEHAVDFGQDETRNDEARVTLSPSEVAQMEQFVPFFSKDESKVWLSIGCNVEELFPDQAAFADARTRYIGEREQYLLSCGKSDGSRNHIRMTFLETAGSVHTARGMLHCHILRALLEGKLEILQKQDPIKASHGIMDETFEAFRAALEKEEWDFDSVQVEAGSAVRLRVEK